MLSCLFSRDGNEAESARAGLGLQPGQIARLAVLLEVFGSAIDPCLTFGEQAADDTGQVAKLTFWGTRLNQFQLFQLHPVGADVGKIVLSLLHKPTFGAAAKHL